MALNLKTDFGAVGDGVAVDTGAVQAARNASAAGGGKIIVPPGRYRVGRINDTLGKSVVFEGEGDASTFLAEASGGIWWDNSGSEREKLKDLTIANYGATVPDTFFFYGSAQAGAAITVCRENVCDVDFAPGTKSNVAHAVLYGSIGWSARGRRWVQGLNGGVRPNNQDNMRTCVLRADAHNRFGLASSFVTTPTGVIGVWSIDLDQTWLTDDSVGLTGNSNNAAFISDGAGVSTIRGGALQSSGIPAVFWCESEAWSIEGYTRLESPNQSLCQRGFLKFGGGSSGEFYLNPFCSALPPTAAGFFIIGEPDPVNGYGLSRIEISVCGVGGVTPPGPVPFLGIDFPMPASPLPNWLIATKLCSQWPQPIVVAGDIQPNCEFTNVSAINGPSGFRNLRNFGNPGYRANPDGTFELFGYVGTIAPAGVVWVPFPSLGLTQFLTTMAIPDGVGGGVGAGLSVSGVSAAGMFIVNQSGTQPVTAHWFVLAR